MFVGKKQNKPLYASTTDKIKVEYAGWRGVW